MGCRTTSQLITIFTCMARTNSSPAGGHWIPRGKALRRPTQAQVNAFNRKLDKLAADLEGLPPDLAKNLDHYLHGQKSCLLEVMVPRDWSG
jgi:hypothetical protein